MTRDECGPLNEVPESFADPLDKGMKNGPPQAHEGLLPLMLKRPAAWAQEKIKDHQSEAEQRIENLQRLRTKISIIRGLAQRTTERTIARA
ncbi:hypothetical protein Dimus_000641 [Dionaea muscipula]